MSTEKVILDVDINVSRSIQQMEQLKIEIKEQQALMKLYGKDTEEFKNVAAKIYGMKEQLKILNTTTQQAVKEQTSVAGSINNMRAQLVASQKAYDNLSAAERDNTNIGKVLLAQIQQQDAELKILEASTGRHQRKVGQYENATKELNEALKNNVHLYNSLSDSEKQNRNIGGELRNVIDKQKESIKKLGQELSTATNSMYRSESVTSRFRDSIQKAGASFTQMFSAMALANLATSALSSAFQGIKQWVSGATEAFTIQENAVTKLKFAIDGNITLLEKYKARASEIQKQTVFGDEKILEIMAYASALQMNEERTNQLVNASIQLATVTGTDVMSAAQMLSKTLTGEVTRSLKVYVTETANLSKEQIKNGAVVDLVAEKYKGFAEAQALTSVGALQKLKNELSDTQEEIGHHTIQFEIYWEKLKGVLASEANDVVQQVSLVSSLFNGFNDLVEEATIKFNQQKKAIVDNITVYAELTKQTKESVAISLQNAKSQSEILHIYSEIVNTINKQKEANRALTEEEEKQIEERKKAAEKVADERKKKLEELEKLRIELMDEGIEKEKAAEVLRYENYIKQWGYTVEAYALHIKKMQAIDEAYRLAEEKKQQDIKNKEQKEREAESKELEKKLAEIQKENEDRDAKEAARKEQQRKEAMQEQMEQLAMVQQYSEQLTSIAAGAIDENGLNLKKFGKNLSLFMLDVLKKQVQAAIGAAVAGSFATPQSIATGGAAGFVQAGILTALIEAAYGVAKAIISREPQGLATGTPQVTKAGVFTVGEQGAEQVILPQGAAVIPNSLMDFAPFISSSTQTADTTAMMLRAIQNIRPYVTVEDINAGQLSEANRVKLSKI